MKKLVKWSLSLFVILGLAFVGLLLAINPVIARLKPQITETISNALQSEVALGEVRARLFPEVAIEVSDLRLANPEGETSKGNAAIEKLRLKTKLGSLLRGDIAISEIGIENANLQITRNKDNSILVGGIALGSRAKPNDTSATKQPNVERKISFGVQSALLEGTNITFIDLAAPTQQQITISNLSAEVRDIAPDRLGSFVIRAGLLGAGEQNLKLSGSAAMVGAVVKLPQVKLETQWSQVDLRALQNLISAYSQQKLDFKLGETADLSLKISLEKGELELEIPELNATASEILYGQLLRKTSGTPLRLSLKGKPNLAGGIVADKAELQLDKISVSLPFSLDPVQGKKIALSSENFPLSSLATVLPSLSRLQLKGSINPKLSIVAPPSAAPEINGQVALEGIEVSLPLSEDKATTIKQIQGTAKFAGKSLELNPLNFTLAEQPFTALIKVSSFERPLLAFALNTKPLDLASFFSNLNLPPSELLRQSSLDSSRFTGTFSTSEKRGSLNAEIKRLALSQTTIENIKLASDFQLNAANQLQSLALKPTSLAIFSGLVNLEGRLENADRVSGSLRAQGLALQQLMSTISPNSRYSILGTLEQLSSQPVFSKASIKTSLSGPTQLRIGKGKITGINFLREIVEKVGTIPGFGASFLSYLPPQAQGVLQSDGTEFDFITASMFSTQGDTELREFALVHSLYQLNAQGTMRGNGEMDLRAQLLLSPTLTEKMVQREPRLQLLRDRQLNIVFPVTIRKKDSFLVLPDVSDLAKRAAQNTAQQAIKQGLDRVTPGLGNALDSLLK